MSGALVGESGIKLSLGTRDPGDATRLLGAALVAFEQWADVRRAPVSQ